MLSSIELIGDYLVSESFLKGAGITLAITIMSCFFGFAIGLILALLQDSRSSAVKSLIKAYLWFFRGTPVLFQIIFIFNALPSFGLTLSGFASGVLALSLNEGAYMAEIFRAGLRSVGAGQIRAGRSLGMKEWQILRHIIGPQALRVILPPAGNQLLGMLKLSALVSVIAVQDLLLVTHQIASANFKYLEALTAAGIYYLAMTTIFMLIQAYVEDRVALRRGKNTKRSLTQRLIGLTSTNTSVR